MPIRALQAILAIALLAGCGEPRSAPPPAADDEVAPTHEADPLVQPEEPPQATDVRQRADALVARLVDGINRGHPATLAVVSAIPPEDADEAAGRAALADYRRYFGGASVARFDRVDEEGNEPRLGRDGRLIYELMASNGTRKSLLVYYEARLDTLRAFDEFLRYSARAHRLADEIVRAIKARDQVHLALLLSPNDIDYPSDLAARGISHYAERFDLETLQASFVGLEQSGAGGYERPFLFSMRGQRDGRPLSHNVRVIIGDGLLGWDDPLIPKFSGI